MRFLIALVLAAALVGCGSGSSSTSTGSENGSGYFGERTGQEETKAAIERGDCRALRRALEKQAGVRVRGKSEPTPPNSRCRLEGHGVDVTISLDTAYEARQRYENRMVEQVQFNAADPAKVPHHIAGVGDPAAGEHFASWIPAYSTLFAVRGNRWLTLAYSVAGETRAQRLAAAVALARLAFRLTSR